MKHRNKRFWVRDPPKMSETESSKKTHGEEQGKAGDQTVGEQRARLKCQQVGRWTGELARRSAGP